MGVHWLVESHSGIWYPQGTCNDLDIHSNQRWSCRPYWGCRTNGGKSHREDTARLAYLLRWWKPWKGQRLAHFIFTIGGWCYVAGNAHVAELWLTQAGLNWEQVKTLLQCWGTGLTRQEGAQGNIKKYTERQIRNTGWECISANNEEVTGQTDWGIDHPRYTSVAEITNTPWSLTSSI